MAGKLLSQQHRKYYFSGNLTGSKVCLYVCTSTLYIFFFVMARQPLVG